MVKVFLYFGASPNTTCFMKSVQRNIEIIHFDIKGTSTDGDHIANFSLGTSINKNKEFTLLGLSIIYELYVDAFNGHSLEFEVRDFHVIDLQGKKANAEELYKWVELTAKDAYRILMGEVSLRGRNTLPPKPNLKKVEIISALNLDIDEYYSIS